MEEWYAKDFVCKLDVDELEDFSPKFSQRPSKASKSFINPDLYKKLNKLKDQISEFNSWDKWSKLVNPYEKITKVGSYSKDNSGNMSREYYKLYEILKYFEHEMKFENIKSQDGQGIKSAHFCEAPGGFIKTVMSLYENIDWYAQTLYDGTHSLKIDPSINIDKRWVRGGDGTGNLYKLENILAFEEVIKKAELSTEESRTFGKKALIVTADGGFDVSYDPNNQEQLSLKLIYSEIVGALHCQEIGGIFICKIFDSNTKPTCQLIYKLAQYYEYLYLIKPRTSRYSNSEKYIVAVDFKGISKKDLDMFDNIITKWNHCDEEGYSYCRDFGIEINNTLSDKLKKYNEKIINNQVKYINIALKGPSLNSNREKQLEAFQNKKAYEYCEAVGLTKRSSGNRVCKHMRTKQFGEGKARTVKKCNKCSKLLI